MTYSPRIFGPPDFVTEHAVPMRGIFDAPRYAPPPAYQPSYDAMRQPSAPMAVHAAQRAPVPQRQQMMMPAAQVSRPFGQVDDPARDARRRIITLIVVVVIAIGITYYLTRLAYKKSPQESAQRLSTPRLARNLFERLEKNKRGGNHDLRRSLERLSKKERPR